MDSRPCFPTKLCNIVEVDCKNKFQCESGNDDPHCVTAALLDSQKFRHGDKKGPDDPDLVYAMHKFQGKGAGKKST